MGIVEGLGLETMLSDVQRMDKRQVSKDFGENKHNLKKIQLKIFFIIFLFVSLFTKS